MLKKWKKVSYIKVEVGDVFAENTFETTVVDVNEDRLNFDRFKKCLDRYEAVAISMGSVASTYVNTYLSNFWCP